MLPMQLLPWQAIQRQQSSTRDSLDPRLNSANLLGDFSGKLSKNGERIALSMPDFLVTTNGGHVLTNRFYAVMDEVTWSDGGRWGRWAGSRRARASSPACS